MLHQPTNPPFLMRLKNHRLPRRHQPPLSRSRFLIVDPLPASVCAGHERGHEGEHTQLPAAGGVSRSVPEAESHAGECLLSWSLSLFCFLSLSLFLCVSASLSLLVYLLCLSLPPFFACPCLPSLLVLVSLLCLSLSPFFVSLLSLFLSLSPLLPSSIAFSSSPLIVARALIFFFANIHEAGCVIDHIGVMFRI